MRTLPEIADLHRVLRLDPETGKLYNRVDRGRNGRSPAGAEAGSLHKNGFIELMVLGQRIKGHRVAFALHHGRWPEKLIDHINGDPADNRPCNLREATETENRRNQGIGKRNKSGIKGVHWRADRNWWQAHINIGKKCMYIGRYHSLEEAEFAYNSTAHWYFGEFARPARRE